MDISIQIDDPEKHTMAVVIDGQRIASGLSEFDAGKLLAKKLNESLSSPAVTGSRHK